MSREQIKDDNYFEEYIITQNTRIKKFVSAVDMQTDLEKKSKLIRVIANMQKDLFAAKYSIGADKNELVRVFDEYLNNMKIVRSNEYAEIIDIISIGILLDYKIEDLLSVCADEQLKDGLFESIVKYPEKSKKTLNYEDYYVPFLDYLSGKVDVKYLANYMNNNWYATNKEFAWYDSDKSKENVYVGYWCWIAAAVMKLKKEDVKQKIMYVPVDII